MTVLELERPVVIEGQRPDRVGLPHAANPFPGAPRTKFVDIIHPQTRRELCISQHHQPLVPSDPDYLQSCMDSPCLETAKPYNPNSSS